MAPMLTVIVGTFMVVLDNTVVNVALPQLGQVFGAELSLLQWVITAYFLAQAAVIPLSGWMSDRFGAKRIYLISLVLFSLGSALCGLAISAQTLIAARVVQGLGGGMLMPIGMAVLFRLTPPERRGAIFALFGIPIMVAPALGPVLGGYLVEFADWRYIFLLNVPVGAVALVMGLRALPALPASRAVGALDTLGIVLAPLAFASLSFGISQSTHYGWTGRADPGGHRGGPGGAGAVHLARADLPAPPAGAARLPQPGLHLGHRDPVGGLRGDVRQLLPASPSSCSRCAATGPSSPGW